MRKAGEGVVFDKRIQGRVRMIPLDVSEPQEIRERLRAYLLALGAPQDLCEDWVEAASAGVSHGGEAFARLRERMASGQDTRTPIADPPEGPQSSTFEISGSEKDSCTALWRLSTWLQTDAQALVHLCLGPAVQRQSMASERLPS